MSEFAEKVIQWVKKIPKGKVATYSQIAGLAGKPNAARGVVWVLNSSSRVYKLPWHRVLNAKGQIAFPKQSANYRQQKNLLKIEGIKFESGHQIDMSQFQWKKSVPRKPTDRSKPKIFSGLK